MKRYTLPVDALQDGILCIVLYFVLYCLDATDLKLSQPIRPAARGRRNDEMIRL